MYLHADIETKKNVLDKTRQPEIVPGNYTPAADVLTWLKKL